MRQYLLGLGFLLAISACGEADKGIPPKDDPNPFAGARVGTDSTVEVMTWNLEHFAKAGNVTVENVADAISAVQPDIVALQEIEDITKFNQLRNALSGYEGVQSTSNRYMNLAYLYRTDGGLEAQSFTDVLVQYSREFPRRPFVMQATFNGQPVVVINNHLKCCGDGTINAADSYDEETRRRDANLLLEQYVDDNFTGTPVFIVGDFNDQLTDRTADNVFQNFLDRPDRFRFADMDVAVGSSAGWSFPGWPSHLDHILITSELFDAHDGEGVLVVTVPLSSYFRYGWNEYDEKVSDHLPVVLKLQP